MSIRDLWVALLINIKESDTVLPLETKKYTQSVWLK